MTARPVSAKTCSLASVAINKIDLAPPRLADLTIPAQKLSALNGAGIDHLMTAALDQLDLSQIAESEPFASTPRQRAILQQAAISSDAVPAAELLRTLTA